MADAQHEVLKARLAALNTAHTFAPGDIVSHKEGLKHKRSPGPFIVVEVLDTPIPSSEGSAGSPYFREPLDIIVGTSVPNGDFVLFHYDSRRFEPVPE